MASEVSIDDYKNYDRLGDAYASSGKYKTAIYYYEKCLNISTRTNSLSGIFNSTSKLGSMYAKLSQSQVATEYYRESFEVSSRIAKLSEKAKSNATFGDVNTLIEKKRETISHLEEKLKIRTAVDDQLGTASNNRYLGDAHHDLGEYQKSIEYYEKSLEISTAIGDQSGIAVNNNNLGKAYACLRQYHKAIDFYHKGLEISTVIADNSSIATSNDGLGNAYQCLGDYQKASDHHTKSFLVKWTSLDYAEIAITLGNLANSYRCLGDYRFAIHWYQKGCIDNTFATAGNGRGRTSVHSSTLGTIYQSIGSYHLATGHYENAIENSTATNDLSAKANESYKLASTYLRVKQYEKAIDCFKQGLEISMAIGDQSTAAICYCNVGMAFLLSGEFEDASSYLVKSIRLFDRIFLNLVSDENKLAFRDQYFIAHDFAMSCFLSLERNESALLAIDIGRAKELHCCIEKQRYSVEKEIVHYAQAISNRIEAREEEIEIKEMQKVLDGGRNDTSIVVFAFDLKNSLNVWVLNDKCIYRMSDSCLETLVSLIRELLEKERVNVTRDSSFFKHDSVTIDNREKIVPSELQSRKGLPRSPVTRYSNLSTQEILKKLFELLIYPVQDSIQGKKLIIVPDKHLFFTPFSALVDENDNYFSLTHSFQITPSLHSLKSSIQRSSDLSIGYALFVGNPAVGKVSSNEGELTLPHLPSATEEVEGLSKLFQATPLLERDATKERVLQLLGGATIVHIAAHGEPNKGEIILAPNSSREQPSVSLPKPDSYLLTQSDIANISLQARLVVLCCCYTGQGEISSEGVIGITRAFLAAGARSVLAALWPIDDTATKEFMKKFYDELCQETTVCEALRRTMNVFQKHEIKDYRSSRAWAPFTIYGEDVKFQKNEIEKIRERSREGFLVST